jgi:hypothetical protein
MQLAEAKDRKARKAAQAAVSQAQGRVSKYEERLQELAATPGVPKVEVGSLEEVRPRNHVEQPTTSTCFIICPIALLVSRAYFDSNRPVLGHWFAGTCVAEQVIARWMSAGWPSVAQVIVKMEHDTKGEWGDVMFVPPNALAAQA